MKIRNNRNGITLVEILIAVAILVFATVAIIQFYLSSIGLSEVSREQTIATAHLINMMESIKCTPFIDLTTDFPNGDVDGPVSNDYATIVGGYELTGEQIVVTHVNPGGNPLELIVSLSWQSARGGTHTQYLVIKRTG